MNTMNSINSISNAKNSFTSNSLYSHSRDSKSKPSSNNPYSHSMTQNKNSNYNHNQFSMNNNNNNNNNNNQTMEARINEGFSFNRNINTNLQSQQNNTNYLTQFLEFLQSNIIRLFASYPTWIQGIITTIIGFIAYFFFDFADGQQSIQSFLFYKILSFIGFLISVAFLYLLSHNLSNNFNRSNRLRPTMPTSLNPYSSLSSQSNDNNTLQRDQGNNMNDNNDRDQFENIGGPKRDELYFTKKSMNRVSSSAYNVDTKYDYSSSPTKIASYDPNQIVTQQGLDKFLDKQSKQNKNQSSLPSMATPMASGVINSNIKTPIGKAFGSMRMTPAVKTMPPLFDTPNKLSGMLLSPLITNYDYPCTVFVAFKRSFLIYK